MNAAQMRQAAEALATLADAGVEVSRVDEEAICVYTHSAVEFTAATNTLKRLSGGEVSKEARSYGPGMVIAGRVNGYPVKVLDLSGEVCRKVLVGTDLVEEYVPDPEWDGDVPMVTVTREVPRYEVVCPDSVLALARDEVSACTAYEPPPSAITLLTAMAQGGRFTVNGMRAECSHQTIGAMVRHGLIAKAGTGRWTITIAGRNLLGVSA